MLPEGSTSPARDYDPSRINRYVTELAARFHRFYNVCRIKDAEPAVRDARLKLADATRRVLEIGLGIIGVTAPEKNVIGILRHANALPPHTGGGRFFAAVRKRQQRAAGEWRHAAVERAKIRREKKEIGRMLG